MGSDINRRNVGRTAERIVANELEWRGFRVSDLNKEGTSSNADLLAARRGKTCQIQVKGMIYNAKRKEDEGWEFQYGFCTDDIVSKKKKAFNRSSPSFYKANIVVLVCVKSPCKYKCVVLRTKDAENAAQINLKWYFRSPKRDGTPHRTGRMWMSLKKRIVKDSRIARLQEEEQAILRNGLDKWGCVERSLRTARA